MLCFVFPLLKGTKEEKRDAAPLNAQRPENPGIWREPQEKTKVKVLHICLAVMPLAPTVCFLRHCWSPLGMHKYVLLLARQGEIRLGSRGGYLKAWEDRQV